MLRERNKLAHRSQRLVQTVELIGAAAVTSGQAAVAIERAINSSIICEIENSFAVRDYEIEIVLVGMNVRNRSEIRRASINVSQIKSEERRVGKECRDRGSTWWGRRVERR